VESATSERKKSIGDLEAMLVQLVGDVLYKCLKKQAEGSSEMVLELSREALKKAQDRVHLRLHLNPEDLKEVESQKDDLKLTVGAGNLELVPDARIEKGGCLLETEAGSVDVRLSTLAEQAKEALSSGAV
jgi:flagellar biosynthesis/type III secretory pathway protein FliH